MATAQTPLALSDIPFTYSIINISFILYNQKVTDNISELYPVALFAGLVGAFIVTIHPFQRLMDKVWTRNIDENRYRDYQVKRGPAKPPPFELGVLIENTILRLGLKTTPIKYEKDKIVAGFYFIITLLLIFYVLLQPWFQHELGWQTFDLWYYVSESGIVIMSIFVIIVTLNEVERFTFKLKLNAVFFWIIQTSIGDSNDWALIKTAIDQNDWDTAKKLIDDVLRSRENLWYSEPAGE